MYMNKSPINIYKFLRELRIEFTSEDIEKS